MLRALYQAQNICKARGDQPAAEAIYQIKGRALFA